MVAVHGVNPLVFKGLSIMDTVFWTQHSTPTAKNVGNSSVLPRERLLFMIVLCTCLAVRMEAAPEKMPTSSDVSTTLTSLWAQVQSFRTTAEEDDFVEIPGRAQPIALQYRARYDIAIDRGSVYCRSQELPDNGRDVISVRKGAQVKEWSRNPIGPGVGKIDFSKSILAERLDEHVGLICLWRDPSTRFFGFDPRRDKPVVVGATKYNGTPVVRVEWSNPAGTYSALLLAEDLLPVFLEQRDSGRVLYSAEITATERIGDVTVPTELVYRTAMPASFLRGGSGQNNILGDIPDNQLLFAGRRFRLKNAQVNPRVAADQFEIQWAQGTEIIDETTGLRSYWQLKQLDPIQESIDAMGRGDDRRETRLGGILAQAAAQRTAATSQSVPDSWQRPRSWVTWLCLAVVVIAASGGYVCYLRHRHQTPKAMSS